MIQLNINFVSGFKRSTINYCGICRTHFIKIFIIFITFLLNNIENHWNSQKIIFLRNILNDVKTLSKQLKMCFWMILIFIIFQWNIRNFNKKQGKIPLFWSFSRQSVFNFQVVKAAHLRKDCISLHVLYYFCSLQKLQYFFFFPWSNFWCFFLQV